MATFLKDGFQPVAFLPMPEDAADDFMTGSGGTSFEPSLPAVDEAEAVLHTDGRRRAQPTPTSAGPRTTQTETRT